MKAALALAALALLAGSAFAGPMERVFAQQGCIEKVRATAGGLDHPQARSSSCRLMPPQPATPRTACEPWWQSDTSSILGAPVALL